MMRAKMKVVTVTQSENGEKLNMSPVCRPNGYPADGSDEDNTFARFSPSGSLELFVANPALFGKFKPGQKFYLDFTLAE
jgi:hypothetical protein